MNLSLHYYPNKNNNLPMAITFYKIDKILWAECILITEMKNNVSKLFFLNIFYIFYILFLFIDYMSSSLKLEDPEIRRIPVSRSHALLP